LGYLSFAIVRKSLAAHSRRYRLFHHSIGRGHELKHSRPGHSDEIHSRKLGATQYDFIALHKQN
jgi:hypothetical protein